MQLGTDPASFIAGFVAGEGMFLVSRPRPAFTFAVSVGGVDHAVCEELREFFGVGTVHWYPRRRPHYDDESKYQVRKMYDLVHVIVPFMDEHLAPSYKREQYLEWRARLLDYWDHGMKRRRECTIDGCTALQRARGLCRHHYFKAGYG